ncbi:MAG: aminopeptidase [Bacilli bacterium]
MYKDERIIKIANTIINYSVKVKENDIVYIKACYESKLLVKEIIKNVYKVGAFPIVKYTDEETERYLLDSATKKSLELMLSYEQKLYQELDCYIQIRTRENESEFVNINPEIPIISAGLSKNLTDEIIQHRRWVLLEWPSKAIAQKANMPFDECVDYMFMACCADFKKISEVGNKLKAKMQKTDKVKIQAKDTMLELSLKDCEIAVTDGRYNLPDGETASAPVLESINGYITFNTPSIYNSVVFNNVKLEFKNGKIIKATADNNEATLNEILNVDEGARYIGEFAFGLNPMVTRPFGSALYDEKIIGSIHLAAGKSLPGICDNGNKSLIHWDLVQIQRPEYGGGKIYFDDEIIMEDGKLINI